MCVMGRETHNFVHVSDTKTKKVCSRVLTWPFDLVLGINPELISTFLCVQERAIAGPSTSTAGVWWSTLPFEPPELWQMLGSAAEPIVVVWCGGNYVLKSGRVVCDKMRPRRRRGWCVGHTSVLGGHDGPVSDVESVDDSCLLCVQATCPGRRVVSQSVFQTNWQKRIGRRESGAVEGWPSQARALPATTRSGRA